MILIAFGSSAAIKAREIDLTADQLAAVRAWILSCEVAWLTCATHADAVELETKLKAEPKPPLAKI
jgi:hypothetical protein